VTQQEREAYKVELRAAARRLGLPLDGNLESALLKHAADAIAALVATCAPTNLQQLLEHAATSLGLEIVEIHADSDLSALLKRIPPSRDPALARVALELDDVTHAVVLRRQNPEPWERRFLAVINCRGRHGQRRYFSKWHELVHLLLEGKQLRLAFRTTKAERKHPEEILVDKIAGELAFFPALFEPVLHDETQEDGRLTFAAIERVRDRIAPDASWQATALAAVRRARLPVGLIRARMGLKKGEARQAADLLAAVSGPPTEKLRVKESFLNDSASSQGIRVHVNMEIPKESAAMDAYSNNWPVSAVEDLGLWRTSSGPIGEGRVTLEGLRRGADLWCLLHFDEAASGRVERRGAKSSRTTAVAPAPTQPLWANNED
jgi:hypothetical protein